MSQPNTSTQRASTPNPADCKHVREPFDQSFHVVGRRADLSADARLLHAFLVSLHRTARTLTQAEMAQEAGLTRHRVWAALRDLVADGLLRMVRYGLGRPNGYELLGVDAADLDGRAKPETGVRPVRKPYSGQSGNLARGYVYTPKNDERMRYPGVRTSGFLETREGHYRDVVRR